MADNAARVQRAIDNYTAILVLCTEACPNPTRAKVDALLTQADALSVPRPKPTYSVDGQSVNWQEYQEFLGRQIEQLQKLLTILAGPYEIRTRALT